MRIRKYILLLLVVGASVLTGCGTIEEVTFGKMQNARLVNADMKALEAEFTVNIKNENKFGFTVTKSDLELSLNGSRLGKVKLKKKVRVKAKSDDPHTFRVKADLSEAGVAGIPALLGLIQSKSPRVKLKGDLKVRTFLFFSKKVPVDVEQVIPLGK